MRRKVPFFGPPDKKPKDLGKKSNRGRPKKSYPAQVCPVCGTTASRAKVGYECKNEECPIIWFLVEFDGHFKFKREARFKG
jgi:hypothetical protein